MKKLLAILLATLSMNAIAKEIITVVSPNNAAGTLIPYYQRIVASANALQNRYEFILAPKPGAQGLVAIQYMDQSPKNRVTAINNGYVELIQQNQIRPENYVPISSQGDLCWVLISNRGDTAKGVNSLKGQTDLVIGAVSYSSGSYLTALELGSRLGFKVTPVIFKSNFDALVLMVGDGSVNLVIETPQNYLNMKQKNPALQALGINCPTRNPKLPEVRTLKEQGFSVPTLWWNVIANVEMPAERRKDIENILEQAMINIGQKEIFDMIDISVPVFQKISAQQHHNMKVKEVMEFRQKYADQISQGNK